MFSRPPLTPFIRKLLIGLFAAYVVQLLLVRFASIPVPFLLGIFPTPAPSVMWLWQVFTHVLVGADLVAVLINLLFLWWMGSPFELRFGERHTMKLVLAATLASGAAGLLAGLFLPSTVIGTGPLVVAFITAFAVSIPPHAELSFFGVLPMKARTLLIVVAAFIVLMAIESNNWGSMFADFAAMAAAYLYLRIESRPQRKPAKKKRSGSSPFKVIQGGQDDRPKYLN